MAAGPLTWLHHVAVQVPRTELLTRALAPLVGRADSLLDVGSGDGAVGEAVGREAGATTIEGVDVWVQGHARLKTRRYDGAVLPYDDDAFEVVLVSDVLHHTRDPLALLLEAARVASRAVVVKDHFAFGRASRALLLALDITANRRYGIEVVGEYFSPRAFVDLTERAGLEIRALAWPLHVHRAPLRWLTRSELQFAARLEPLPAMGAS